MKRLWLIGAAAGAVSLLSLHQDVGAASSNTADTYKQLNLFGDVFELVRGPVNSDINLTIRREGREPFDVKLTRAIIKIQSVRSHLEGDNIAYVRITTFNEQTDVGLNN